MTEAVDDPHLEDLAPSHVPAIHLVPTDAPGLMPGGWKGVVAVRGGPIAAARPVPPCR
jgi:hypothetical protein